MAQVEDLLIRLQEETDHFFTRHSILPRHLAIGGEPFRLFLTDETFRQKLVGLSFASLEKNSPMNFQLSVLCLPEAMELAAQVKLVLRSLRESARQFSSSRFILDWSTDRLSFIERAERKGYCIYFDSHASSAKPLDPELRMSFSFLNKFLIHAAAYVKGPDCLLTFGESGAGKSFSSLRALENGWTVLGDDRVLLSRTGEGIECHSVFNTLSLKLSAEPKLNLPVLKELEGKKVFQIAENDRERSFSGGVRAYWLEKDDTIRDKTAADICLKIAADLTYQTLFFRRNYLHFNFLVPSLLRLLHQVNPVPITRLALLRELEGEAA